MHQQLLWFLIGTTVWTLMVAVGDLECYESVGVDIVFDGKCKNKKTYPLIVGSDDLEVHFSGAKIPSDPQKIDLSIGGCAFRVFYLKGQGSGVFTYNADKITKATASSNKITFDNNVPTNMCSVKFEATKDGKYKVNVWINQDPDQFSIIFKDASFDPSVTSGYPVWVWILCSVLGIGFVVGVIATVVLCCKKNKKEKARPVESKLSVVKIEPVNKKHYQRRKTHSHRNKSNEYKKDSHYKKAYSEYEPRDVSIAKLPTNEDTDVKGGGHGKFGRLFVDDMTVMKRIMAPPSKPKKEPKANEDFTNEEKALMEKRAEVFKTKFNYEYRLKLTPEQVSRFHNRSKNTAEISQEPENEWTQYHEMAKKADDQKSTIAYVFNITDGKKVFVHGSMEQMPSVQHASSECNVEMPTDPLEQAKFERLRRFIGYSPWIVGFAHEFYEAQLKAVKFVGSIADDVLAVHRGTKKSEYPWAFRDGRQLAHLSRRAILSALYLDPADHHEVAAMARLLTEMKQELQSMKAGKARNHLKARVERMKFLVHHSTEIEKLEASEDVAFAAGKRKPRSTNAEDDDEKFGV